MNGNNIIRKEYGDSRNFMTPGVVEYGNISDTIGYEISRGEGFNHEPIYGLSCAYLKKDGTTERFYAGEVSRMFRHLSDARRRVVKLQEFARLIRSGQATCPTTSGIDLSMWDELLAAVNA